MNKGALALLRAAKAKGYRLQRQIADETGFDEPRVSRLLHGGTPPNRPESARLLELYEIPLGLWDEVVTQEEHAEIKAGLRGAPSDSEPARTGS